METATNIILTELQAKYITELSGFPQIQLFAVSPERSLLIIHDDAVDLGLLQTAISAFHPLEKKVDVRAALGRIYTLFVADIFRLEPRLATIQGLLEAGNFSGLKVYLQGAKAANLITDEDIEKFETVLLEQNIDLENY